VRSYGYVTAYDANFNYLCQVSIPTQSWVHYGLCLDSQGRIHTPSAFYPTIYVVSPDCPMSIIGAYPAQDPSAVEMGIESSGGAIYTCNGNGVWKYAEDGTPLGSVVPSGEDPQFICQLSHGRMAVCLGGPLQVAIFGPSWNEICRFGAPGNGFGQFESFQGIAPDAIGDLYVSDAALHRVQKFDEVPTIGDCNCDGGVTFADIDLFVEALAGLDAWSHPGCPWLRADCNGDGGVTFADIDYFIALIGS
jgi:hypothetical protein